MTRAGDRPQGPAAAPLTSRRRLRRIAAHAAILTLVAVVAFLLGVATAPRAFATTAAEDPFFFIKQLAQVLVLVENEYVDPVDRERLIQGAIQGMVSELDPHSSYLTPGEYNVFRGDTQGEFGGIGVEVDFQRDAVTIIAPIDGSPAARAGLRPGDEIVAVDKQSARDLSPAQLVRRMRGKPGSELTLSVRRRGRTALMTFALKREIIQVSSVESKSLDGNVVYLRVKQFQAGTHTEVLQAIAQRRSEQKIDGLILDLRNNPGGLVDEAAQVADEFLKSGIVYTTRHRDEVVDEVTSSNSGALQDPPAVVLVNEYSASAAELLAGALQDNGRATLVGARTFGKGSVQSIIDLPGGAGLRLTTMRYYTPKGRSIQATGIAPDVVVEAGYKPDTSFGVTRESDLDNHLSGDGSTPRTETPAFKPPAQEEEEIGVSPTYLGVARVVPKNPAGGPDFALSIGYQIITGILKKQ